MNSKMENSLQLAGRQLLQHRKSQKRILQKSGKSKVLKKKKLEIELANFKIKESQNLLKGILQEVNNNSFQFIKAQIDPQVGSMLDVFA